MTPLPDSDLMIKDVWPLPGRAFAIAESPTLGVKVLEWKDGGSGWSYIDDNTQNEVGGKYAGTIWAPNDDTVYYAVAPSFIYRGTRLSPPATGWSWSRQRLDDNSHVGEAAHASHDHGYPRNPSLQEKYPALGVWGTDGSNVYAWYSNTVYHWTSNDGGAPEWVAEYVADDLDVASDHLFFVSAAGSSADDVWFAAVRSDAIGEYLVEPNCAVLVRKTPAGFARVADGIVRSSGCAERAGFLRLDGAHGLLTDIQATGPGQITGLKGSKDIVRISAEGDTVAAAVDNVPTFNAVNANGLPLIRSLWRSSTDVWLTSFGLVIRGQGTGDAGTYAVSTIALNGRPISSPMYRVRGSSDTNIWATGNGYAFHKTTP